MYLANALQFNTAEERKSFFESVRACKRRTRRGWELAPVAKLFTAGEQTDDLSYQAKISRIRTAMVARGLPIRDAFEKLDKNRDGQLSNVEMYLGLKALGLKMAPADVVDLMKGLDADHDYVVTREEFEKAFMDEALEQELKLRKTQTVVEPSFDNTTDEPIPYAELGESEDPALDPHSSLASQMVLKGILKPKSASNDLTAAVLNALKLIKLKTHTHNKFSPVWDSTGSLTEKSVQIYQQERLNIIGLNKFRVTVGHFAAQGHHMSKQEVLEISDTGVWKASTSSLLPLVVNNFLPHPKSFLQVWAYTRGKQSVYAWMGKPPSSLFVTIGIVFTTTDAEPPREIVHCVPIAWCTASKTRKKVWDNSGNKAAGQRPCSIWQINSLGGLAMGNGRDEPEGHFYDLATSRFFVDTPELALIKHRA
eukprot:c19781_g1_i2.p1 GENE.c19781_g1_i2~~c19781_g1_i2.p1  ORF type:complete len:435 (+),score=114.15 c19781_g1_i2:37-1305(+)